MNKTIDPKKSQADKKLSFDSVPLTLMLIAERACKIGADKYGVQNWIDLEDGSMSVSTYLNAVQRHLTLYKAGQDNASDSGVNHLDHIIAGLAVVRDAMILGKTKDDRKKLSKEQLQILEDMINNNNNKDQTDKEEDNKRCELSGICAPTKWELI